MVDWQHIAELAAMAALNVVSSLSAIKTHLRALDSRVTEVRERADHAHQRIDTILERGAKS